MTVGEISPLLDIILKMLMQAAGGGGMTGGPEGDGEDSGGGGGDDGEGPIAGDDGPRDGVHPNSTGNNEGGEEGGGDNGDDPEGTPEEPNPEDDYPEYHDDGESSGTQDDPIEISPEDADNFEFEDKKWYKVDGQLVKGHALNAAKDDNISWWEIQDAIDNPVGERPGGNGNDGVYGESGIGVTINSNGGITTVFQIE